MIGLTPRDLAMQCDFYDCADLLDEMEQLQAKLREEKLKETRVQGIHDDAQASRACNYGWSHSFLLRFV